MKDLNNAGNDRVLYPDSKPKSPGGQILMGGDENYGYFGITQASELITGDDLASEIGLRAGVSQFSNEGWLKFADNGKTLYVAKKTFRHSLSWDQINAQGIVSGKEIEIDGLTYKVRLMKGLGGNGSMSNYTGNGNHDSEWNRLILPIHERPSDKSWEYGANVEADIPDWGVGFTDSDLQTHNRHGNGSYSWVQETVYNSSQSLLRGGLHDVSSSYNLPSSASYTSSGWRSVLELVPDN